MMKATSARFPLAALLFAAALSLRHGPLTAQDWPQWRGLNRDARATDFKAPNTWPKELTSKWKITVGEGVASPALVGDRVYVFSREDGNEVTRCLAVADGKELWQEKYESLGATGPAQSFSGPRSSPAVSGGRVLTVGVRGMVSVLDAENGTKLWRKDDFRAYPNFFPSSSPLILDGLAVAQLGGRENGALVAYDVASGAEKWRWSGPCPSYASPALVKVGGDTLTLIQTETRLAAIKASDGSLAWESAEAAAGGGGPRAGLSPEPGRQPQTFFGQAAPPEGRPPGGPGMGGGGGRGGMGGRDYRASSPVVDGNTFFLAGRGVKALRLEKEGDKFVAREIWQNPDKTIQFNTPVLKDGKLYGLTANNELFCLDAKNGQTLWGAPFPGSPAPAGGGPRASLEDTFPNLGRNATTVFGQATPAEPGRPGGPGGPGGPGMGGRRGGGMGGSAGYGNIVDAGPVLLALTPAGQLVVFEPGGTEFKQVAAYKVADGQTYAYPVLSGNRILIKDKDTLALWTVE